jgi:hypothetical protein
VHSFLNSTNCPTPEVPIESYAYDLGFANSRPSDPHFTLDSWLDGKQQQLKKGLPWEAGSRNGLGTSSRDTAPGGTVIEFPARSRPCCRAGAGQEPEPEPDGVGPIIRDECIGGDGRLGLM